MLVFSLLYSLLTCFVSGQQIFKATPTPRTSLANWPMNTSSGVVFMPSRAPQIGTNWTLFCPTFCHCDYASLNSIVLFETKNYDNHDGDDHDSIEQKSTLRRIVCSKGNLTSIPLYQIPPHIQWIELRGANDSLNKLTLGPVFYRFERLKVLIISFSSVPAIGPVTFQYRIPLDFLDLSHNRINNLNDANFNGLKELSKFDLSFNNITDLTSARFQSLSELRWLNLSHNCLKTITTRLFYNLTQLEILDLSWNPIEELPPQSTLDLYPLKILFMSNCKVRQLDSLFYRNVPHLVYFDLRNNHLETLAKSEFRHLSSLRTLLLDGNRLINLGPNTFQPVKLDHLGLSMNNLIFISSAVFLNSSIEYLNLCGNSNLTTIDSGVLLPLSSKLKRLELCDLPNLDKSVEVISGLLRPLTQLESLNIANTNLSASSEKLSSDIFTNFRSTLQELNMSHNGLVNVSAAWFNEMSQLNMLDFSHNSLIELTSDVLYVLTAHANLSRLYIDKNPWSCFRCHLLYLRNWISPNAEQLATGYHSVCKGTKGRCAECAFPPHLAGILVHQMEEWQLEWCTDPTVQLRVSTTEPNVGLVLALLIIIILIIVIVGVIVYYRNRGAIYFTHEDLLYGRASTINNNNPISDHGDNGDHTHHHHRSLMSRNAAHQNFHSLQDDYERSSSIYNVSNRIRYFAEATAENEFDDHTDRSSFDDSLTVNSIRKLQQQQQNKMNGISTLPRARGHYGSQIVTQNYATVRKTAPRQVSRATSGASSQSSRGRAEQHRYIVGPPPPLPRVPPPKTRNVSSHINPIKQRSKDVSRALKQRLESIEKNNLNLNKTKVKVEEKSDFSDEESDQEQISLSEVAVQDESIAEDLKREGASSAEIEELHRDDDDAAVASADDDDDNDENEYNLKGEEQSEENDNNDTEISNNDSDKNSDDEVNVTETKRRIADDDGDDNDSSEESSNRAYAEGSSQSSNS